MKNPDAPQKRSNQLVGNIGLFYVCYELSKRGWNCLPTSRNAKEVDLVVYSQNAKKTYTMQIKALSRKNPVPFGSSANLMADFVIVSVLLTNPEIYILAAEEVRDGLHKAERDGRVSYWLQTPDYQGYKDCWGKIGDGFEPALREDNARTSSQPGGGEG